MRILILSWEFPPRIVGTLGMYVEKLARTLATHGVEVYIVTLQNDAASPRRFEDLTVLKVSNPVTTHINIVTWDLTLMTEFERVSSNIYYSVEKKVDLVDGHEWLCVPAAVLLKKAYDLPFLFSIHSLEEHRSNYTEEPLNQAIHSLEHLGITEADRILVESNWMKHEICKFHRGFESKIETVSPDSPNWIGKVIDTYTLAIRERGELDT